MTDQRQDPHVGTPPDTLDGLRGEIQALREREAVLRQSEGRFRALFAAIDEGYCLCEMIVDHDGHPVDYRFVEVNSLFESMTGLHNALGRTAREMVPGLEREWVNSYARVGLDGETRRFQQGSDATDRWFDVFATPVEPHGFFVLVFRDITDRRRAMRAVEESEERLRLALQGASGGVWDWDLARNDTWWSPEMYELCGVEPRERVSRAVALEGIVTADHARIREAMVDAINNRTDYRCEFRILHPTRGERWMFAHGRLLWNDTGTPARVVGITLDITDRKSAEQAIRDNDLRKDKFLATLAHELRNPLAPLRTGLQLVRLARNQGETADLALTTMERQVKHMVRLIDDLLDMSRINQGHIGIQRERLALATVVQHAVEANHALVEQGGLRLTLDLPAEPLTINGDAIRLAQVFGNLLHNAAKFTAPGGHVVLTVRREEGDAVVSVRDTGVGIPVHLLDTVFEMFTQVESGLTHSQGGLGIGLWLVRQLVELHGGSVRAHSDGHNSGSEFIVRLPLATQADEIVTEPLPPQMPTRPLRILVVDDNRDAASTLATMLSLVGHVTWTANDGATAIASAEAAKPDVVLLDLGMAGLDGFEVAREIRRHAWGRRLVLVALTGWGQDEDRRRSREAGFDHHFVKPVEPLVLEGLLASVRPHS